MKTLLAAVLLLAAPALADDVVVKLFTDKGSTFLKADKAHPAAVGTELTACADAACKKTAGSAMVMEVTGALTRVTLDEEAVKAGAKFAKLPAGRAAVAAPPAAADEKPVEKGLDKLTLNGPELKGKLENGMRVGITNDSADTWTECELRFDDGRFYKLGELAKHSDDTVVALKFTSRPSPPEPLYDHVVITCDEGETKFLFANPHSPGALNGYVENAGSGRVIVHNSSDKQWTRCDVKKPDRSHYIMEKLKAQDSESIRSGNFVKEKEPPAPKATQLVLNCAQGHLSLDLR